MTSESWSVNVTGTVSRTYNNDFQTTEVTVGAYTAGYTYDNDGLLLTAGDMTITRDPESGLVTGTALDTIATTQTYNTFGEIATYDAGDYSYEIVSRDNLGRITEKDETIEGITTTYQYTYDKAGRLETVTENGLLTNQYAYYDNGNRTSKNGITATHNGQDQIIQDGYSTYTYTANGDLETKVNPLGTTTYTHDALGNLTQVNLPNNDVISYTYDGRNRRIAKMVNGTITERFVYQNQLKPAAKVDANGNILEQYIYGTRINTPDYILKNGEQYRVISDERGSVKLVINASDGTISQKIDYDEFGNVITDTNPGFQPFYYAGGVYDLDTQLVKFGARDYDPVTGRWLQKEPLGFAGSDNFYSYCDGDPVNFVDVNGLEPITITIVATITAVTVYYFFKSWLDNKYADMEIEMLRKELEQNPGESDYDYELRRKETFARIAQESGTKKAKALHDMFNYPPTNKAAARTSGCISGTSDLLEKKDDSDED